MCYLPVKTVFVPGLAAHTNGSSGGTGGPEVESDRSIAKTGWQQLGSRELLNIVPAEHNEVRTSCMIFGLKQPPQSHGQGWPSYMWGRRATANLAPMISVPWRPPLLCSLEPNIQRLGSR